MERKRNSGFRRIFTVDFVRQMLIIAPQGEEIGLAGSRNRRKANGKIRRNRYFDFNITVEL